LIEATLVEDSEAPSTVTTVTTVAPNSTLTVAHAQPLDEKDTAYPEVPPSKPKRIRLRLLLAGMMVCLIVGGAIGAYVTLEEDDRQNPNESNSGYVHREDDDGSAGEDGSADEAPSDAAQVPSDGSASEAPFDGPARVHFAVQWGTDNAGCIEDIVSPLELKCHSPGKILVLDTFNATCTEVNESTVSCLTQAGNRVGVSAINADDNHPTYFVTQGMALVACEDSLGDASLTLEAELELDDDTQCNHLWMTAPEPSDQTEE
jgi:hypothetical protein